jgi:DNA-binding FadR family transcriptional regulator
LKRLEDSLVKTQTIEEARELLAGERELITQFGESRKPIRKALEHLDYLRDYWTTDNLWKSWSD